MKKKILSLMIALTCLVSNLSFVSAITPSAKVELDTYSVTISELKDVKISGTVSKAYGQKLLVKDSNKVPILIKTLPDLSGNSTSFEYVLSSSFIKEGTNTFQVQSSNLLGKVSASNPKTLTITYKKAGKQNQIITVGDKSVQVGKTVNLNASTNSGLPLSYLSNNTSIAIVDSKGVITGKKEGTAIITISQPGNELWKGVAKEVKVTVIKAAATTSNNKSTYTIVYNSNGGKGSMPSQKVEVGKSVKLNANKFKREGYTFVGWATKDTKANLPKNFKREGIKSKFTSSTAKKYYSSIYKNINMKHFQLGIVKYKNTATVKNLATKNKTITLYAVWKGSGAQAAVDWGHIIANEDIFWYGKWKPAGSSCFMCGRTTKPAYVCHTFAVACYTHGANVSKNCKKSPTHKPKFWTNMKTTHGKFKNMGKPKYSNLKTGDIILRTTHTWIYAGNGVVLESGSSSGPKNDARRAKQIAWKNNKAKSAYKNKKVTNVIRFTG